MTTYTATTRKPAPSPWTIRPPISIGIDVLSPDSTSPPPKVKVPPSIGNLGPIRSHTSPATPLPNIAAPRNPGRAHGYSDKPPSSRAATGSDVATAMNSKATARIREKIPHDRGRRPDAKGLVEVPVSSATALIRAAGECYSPSPPPLSPPPSDNDSQTSLHSGQTGYFLGSRLGTQT